MIPDRPQRLMLSHHAPTKDEIGTARYRHFADGEASWSGALWPPAPIGRRLSTGPCVFANVRDVIPDARLGSLCGVIDENAWNFAGHAREP